MQGRSYFLKEVIQEGLMQKKQLNVIEKLNEILSRIAKDCDLYI